MEIAVNSTSEPDVNAVIAGLKSRNKDSRADAERAIKAMGVDGLNVLLPVLQQERRNYKKRQKVYWLLWWIMLPVAFYFCFHFGESGGVIAFCLVAAEGALRSLLGASWQYKCTTEFLKQYDDVRAIPLLLEAVDASLFEVRRALIQLLPQLQAKDAELLGPSQRQQLYSDLRRMCRPGLKLSSDEPYTLAILKALEQIGDGDAVPHIQHLIRFTYKWRVRKAALDCLPFLQLKWGEQQGTKTLLRAAAPSVQPETLLRPAVSADSPDEQLLRASAEGQIT